MTTTLQPAGAALESLEAAGRHVALLVAEIEQLKAENAQWRIDFKEMVIERNEALARLAAIEAQHTDEVMNGLMLEKSLTNLQTQEPVATVDRTAPGFIAWAGIPKLKEGAKLYAAAGASPLPDLPRGECFTNGAICAKCGHPDKIVGAQPSQAQIPAPPESVQGVCSTDGLYEQAVAIVKKHQRASISLVQRHLRISYNRATRLLEDMAKDGLITSNNNGSYNLAAINAKELK